MFWVEFGLVLVVEGGEVDDRVWFGDGFGGDWRSEED